MIALRPASVTAAALLAGCVTCALLPAGDARPRRPAARQSPATSTAAPAEFRGRLPMVKQVLVLNFDPTVPDSGGQTLHQFLGWNDPRALADQYVSAVWEASDHTALYRIRRWIDIDDTPVMVDGFQYAVADYVDHYLSNSGWHDTIPADYYKVLEDFDVARLVDRGIDEVWIFAGPYFGFWEAAMAGPGAYFINGGVYPDVAVDRPFAIMGFSPERTLAEMLHNLGHRTENHLTRMFGESWNMAQPEDAWDDFTANLAHTAGSGPFGAGNVHFPFNGTADYDYLNTTPAPTYVYEFENYPFYNAANTQLLNCAEWVDLGISYEQWWLDRLPDNPGVDSDGRQNNWWRYIVNFDDYEAGTGLPK